MDLNFTSKSPTVQSRANECFGQFCWPPRLELNKVALFNHIGHLLLLLLSFIGLFLQIGDLLANGVEAMAIWGAKYDRANEGCIRVFKGLRRHVSRQPTCHTKAIRTVSSFFPASCPGVWKLIRMYVNSPSSFLLAFFIVLMWKGTAKPWMGKITDWFLRSMCICEEK